MNSREICLRILRSESESEVNIIIESEPALSDPSNWHPIDDRETNFNVVTNQASTGSKALTELCTNMVDAVLMKHAYMQGISLTGPDAPKSVIDGVRELVRLKGAPSGVLYEVDSERYLQEFSEKNLIIGVTGGTSRNDSLCFTFIDNGEGQHAIDFEDTFLSLSKGTKSDIPFVQGKYNMGSSGVLTYCGRQWYKLILSRRHDESSDWGWTLVRRRPGSGKPVAEYFKSADEIPTFSESLIKPMKLNNGKPDEKVGLATGTIVKLYDYQMESATSFRNIRESLNENLVSTILPFRLMDYRYPPEPKRGGRRAIGVDERPLNGMEFLLLRERGEYEPGREHHIGVIEHPDLGIISIKVIELERDIPGWLKSPRNTSRVFHAVNGQVQFKENRGYISQRCKFPGLKDRIAVIVDASDLSEAAHNDVWKGDRENIRATKVGQLYRNEVTTLISSSVYLKELQQRIAREETENLSQESQQSLFQTLINTDPNIAQLLPGGALVTLKGSPGPRPDDDEWKGKYSPTFLDLIGRNIKESGAEIAVGGRRQVGFKTDVVNGYLSRPDNRGRAFAIGGIRDKFPYSNSVFNGRLTVTFAALVDKVKPGDEFSFSMCLLDDSMPEPVTEAITLKVVKERKPRLPGPPPTGPDNGDDEDKASRGLPPTKWLTQDGRSIGEEETDRWPDDFTDQDGGKVGDLGENQRLFYINYDNAHFRHFLDKERDDVNKKVVAEQYRTSMLVLMMGLEEAYEKMRPGDDKTNLGDYIDEIRRLTAQGAATVVMSIAKTISTMVNPASVADPDDD